MRSATTIAVAVAASLVPLQGAADTLTPIVPNDIGHWLNIEYRTGTLAPAIAGNRPLIDSILVVERSADKIDAFLRTKRLTSGCVNIGLPYFRVTREPVTTAADSAPGRPTTRTVKRRETLSVRVCTDDRHRAVLWRQGGSLFIITRLRSGLGGFSRTRYVVQQATSEELARVSRRNARRVAQHREPKPPHLEILHAPPVSNSDTRGADPFLQTFSAEVAFPRQDPGTLTDGFPPFWNDLKRDSRDR